MQPPSSLLPEPSARVATFGGAPPPAPPWDVAIVAAAALGSLDWRAVAEGLREGGKLLAEAPPGSVPGDAARDALEIALGSAGFALRRPRREIDPGWIEAVITPYTVRAFREGEEEQILDLFERSFHHRRGAEHWRWQYRSNPSQPSQPSQPHPVPGTGDEAAPPRVVVATDPGGALVAHYAGYPVAFRQGSRRFLAHQIGDTMTAPEVRSVGRGPTSLLARCGHHFYARFCRRQVAFNYGFNVGNIQKFSIRFLAAHRVEDVPYRSRAAAAPLPPAPRTVFGRPRYRVVMQPRPDAEWDALFETAAPHYGALVERSARHLHWRYLDRPGFDYQLVAAHRRNRLVAWAVFRRDGDRLLWGDLLVHPRHGDAAGALLAAALADPANAGVETVAGWFPPRPAFLDAALEALGFEQPPEPQGLALMCVPFEDPEAPRWLGETLYYTLGDGDLF